MFFCPVLSGHYGFVLVYWHGLKDFEDRHGGAVHYRATISADFGRKVPIFPCLRLGSLFLSFDNEGGGKALSTVAALGHWVIPWRPIFP